MNKSTHFKLKLNHKQSVSDTQIQAYMNKKTTHDAHLLLHSLGFDLYSDSDQLMIPDLTLAESLGYGSPRSIRKLIKRHGGSLLKRGSLVTYYEDTGEKGRPSTGHLLTLEQALYVITKSETEIADELLFLMIEIVSAFMRGDLLPTDFKTALRLQESIHQSQLAIARHVEEKEARRDAFEFLNTQRKRKRKPSVKPKAA
jgi:hypothetical protein